LPLQLGEDSSVVRGDSFVKDAYLYSFPLLDRSGEDEINLFGGLSDRNSGEFLAVGDLPLLLEELKNIALGRGIEVSGEDGREVGFLSNDLVDLLGSGQAGWIGAMVEMSAEKEKWLRQSFGLKFTDQDTSLFAVAGVGQMHIFVACDGKFGEYCIAIFAALEADVFSKDHLHSSEFRQFGRLVHLVDTLGLLIDLLQGNHIRTNGLDHFGNAFQIQLSVDASSVMNVVAEHSYAKGFRGGGAGSQCQKEDDQGERRGDPGFHFCSIS